MPTSSLVPPIRTGIRAHVRSVFPFHLPRGLATDTEVTVEQILEGEAVVRDAAGNRWHVDIMSIDPGRLVWRNGHWEPEVRSSEAA